jgi:preprotein translocase subunit SecG|tara:strand:- start:83 stop:406 length:324 start_codon:yes stop_codon:yes gene_type:complete
MATFLMIISSIAAILLIIIVLLQNSKGGGLDSSYGNVNQLGGVAQSTETIEKATWSLAGIIGFLSILAAFNFSGNVVENSTEIDQSEGVSLPSTNQPGNLPIDLPQN